MLEPGGGEGRGPGLSGAASGGSWELIAGAHCHILLETAGGLAQLGERDNGIVEVTGSIPVSSTIPPALAGLLARGRPFFFPPSGYGFPGPRILRRICISLARPV